MLGFFTLSCGPGGDAAWSCLTQEESCISRTSGSFPKQFYQSGAYTPQRSIGFGYEESSLKRVLCWRLDSQLVVLVDEDGANFIIGSNTDEFMPNGLLGIGAY